MCVDVELVWTGNRSSRRCDVRRCHEWLSGSPLQLCCKHGRPLVVPTFNSTSMNPDLLNKESLVIIILGYSALDAMYRVSLSSMVRLLLTLSMPCVVCPRCNAAMRHVLPGDEYTREESPPSGTKMTGRPSSTSRRRKKSTAEFWKISNRNRHQTSTRSLRAPSRLYCRHLPLLPSRHRLRMMPQGLSRPGSRGRG